MPTEYERLAADLRRAVAHRDSLRPGTPARWRAECEAKALMKRLVAQTPVTHPELSGNLNRPVLPPSTSPNTPSVTSIRSAPPSLISGAAAGASAASRPA
jgi:hypothetical protein